MMITLKFSELRSASSSGVVEKQQWIHESCKVEQTVRSQQFIKGLGGEFKEVQQWLLATSHLDSQTLGKVCRKPQGYIRRLFSDETWSEWTDDLTPLGRIFERYTASIRGETPPSKQYHGLTPNLLSQAKCLASTALGALGSAVTKSPFPLLTGLTQCLPPISATIEKVDSEFQCNTYTSGSQYNPKVGALGNNRYVVVWTSSGTSYSGTYGQIFNGDQKEGGEFRINTDTFYTSWEPALAMDLQGNFVVVWASSRGLGDLYGQRFNTTGGKVGGEFHCGTSNYEDHNPDIAFLSNGDFVVTWEGSQTRLWAQLFGADAIKKGQEFRVNTFNQASTRSKPKVVAFEGGGFCVLYESQYFDNSDYAVAGQCFDNDGNFQSSEIVVNTYTSMDQYRPTVPNYATDRFTSFWRGYGYGPVFGIFGQTLSKNGDKLGGEIPVKTDNSFSLNLPSVDVNPLTNHTLLFWRQEDTSIIMGQLLSQNGTKIDGEFPVSNSTNCRDPDVMCAPDSSECLVAYSSNGEVRAQLLRDTSVSSTTGEKQSTGTTDALNTSGTPGSMFGTSTTSQVTTGASRTTRFVIATTTFVQTMFKTFSDSDSAPVPSQDSTSDTTPVWIAIGVALGIVGCIVVGGVTYYFLRKKSKESSDGILMEEGEIAPQEKLKREYANVPKEQLNQDPYDRMPDEPPLEREYANVPKEELNQLKREYANYPKEK